MLRRIASFREPVLLSTAIGTGCGSAKDFNAPRRSFSVAITAVSSASLLASIVAEVSRSMEWALGVFAQWSGASGKVEYRINRDYNPTGMSAQDITAYLGAVQAGELSSQEFFELLQRGDVIDGGKSFDEHQSEIEIQAPAPTRPALPAPMEEAA